MLAPEIKYLEANLDALDMSKPKYLKSLKCPNVQGFFQNRRLKIFFILKFTKKAWT